MIKKLRFKFILVSLASILFVLASAIAAINIHIYREVEKSANEYLVEIVDRGMNDGPPDGEVPPEPPAKHDAPINPGRPEEDDDLMSEHYFVVSFNQDGTVNESNFRHIFSLSDEQCLSFAKSIFDGDKTKGKDNAFRYLKQEKEGLIYVAVIDVQNTLNDARSFLVISLIISSMSMVVIAGLIIGASFFVFKPSEVSYKKQKQFITNASHELKTPLTIISTDVEIIEMDNGKSEWTESIKDQVKRLTRMTNELVTLSKMDELDAKTYPVEPFNLSEVATQCFDTFSPLFAKAKIKLSYNIEKDITLNGNKAAIDELFRIFLENSIKYTKENGSVNAIIKKEKNNIIVSIKNDVRDVTALDPDQLFDRFYTSSGSLKTGSGIGLSIAKEIVRLHKGDIKAILTGEELEIRIVF